VDPLAGVAKGEAKIWSPLILGIAVFLSAREACRRRSRPTPFVGENGPTPISTV
jgi:hypothetical protein